MTSLIIDLTVSQLASTTVQASLPTSTAITTITTTTLPSPPPQPQQGVSNSIIIKWIGELERCIADLVEENQTLEERRFCFNACLRMIMTRAMRITEWPMKHYKKSILSDESEQFDADKAEERKKIKSKHDSPKTPPGSPPPPPPPPPPSGASGASDTTGASDFAQDPLLPPPSLTPNPDDQSPGSATPGSSKIAGTTAYTAWTTTTSRFEPSALSIPEDVFMHEESDFAAQDMVSGDEDIGNERPATPIPAWSIPSSSLPVPIHNWASAIASSYVPPPENSLLSQTSDIGVFIDWFCKKQGITELTPEHLEVLAYEVIKACHPDVIHLQFQMEECYKLLTNQVDDRLLRYNISRPL
ncbi:hypothetical protein Tco_0331365, partial [Tanacetum coccineum]